MRIEYKNTFFDLFRFSITHQFFSVQMQSVWLLLCAGLFYLVYAGADFMGALRSAMVAYVVMWLAQGLFLFVYLGTQRHKAFITTHSLEIADQGLIETTPYNHSVFYWNGAIKARARPGFMAVYMDANAAHIIPNRAFDSKEARSRFLALIREKTHNAHGPKERP